MVKKYIIIDSMNKGYFIVKGKKSSNLKKQKGKRFSEKRILSSGLRNLIDVYDKYSGTWFRFSKLK